MHWFRSAAALLLLLLPQVHAANKCAGCKTLTDKFAEVSGGFLS
jgi:hypothetical protein